MTLMDVMHFAYIFKTKARQTIPKQQEPTNQKKQSNCLLDLQGYTQH